MFDCSASIVIYNNPPEMVRNVIKSFLSCSLNVVLHVVDNSPTEALKSSLVDLPVKYYFYGSNAGYGRGHNKALEECSESKYHVIINPDIIIAPSTIETLSGFMNDNPDIAMVCPKVLNEDGSIQHLNKRYPTVFDLFARRFIPNSLYYLIQRRMERYEMKDVGYEDICDVECISGCFMFCRSDALKMVGGFDDRYFMYFEDFDLSRKFQQVGIRTVYCPYATVTHLWERASHKSIKMTWVFIVNMFRYFNKWGWNWL
jgi:GT2 family glycosyltransferase